jgi:HD-GYP domain-containing protein (c-di-GMP phosphodiesterase class II)
MIGPRPYRRGMTEEAAIAELRACAGTQFDPQVVEAFSALRAEGSTGAERQLAAMAL